MASRSSSITPPTTPRLMEGEPEEAVSPRQHSELDFSGEESSLLPVVDLSDDNDRSTPNTYSTNDGQISSSLPKVAPSFQTILGRRYLSPPQQTSSFLQKTIQPPRRNPVRLARPAPSLEVLQRRRRSKSPSQEADKN